jgi:hypothetical protein
MWSFIIILEITNEERNRIELGTEILYSIIQAKFVFWRISGESCEVHVGFTLSFKELIEM